MRASYVFFKLFTFLLYPCIISTTLLYLYPFFFGCAFPAPEEAPDAAHQCILDQPKPGESRAPWVREIESAPFRLLVFGDPQLEGDTSLPDSSLLTLPSLHTLQNCRLDLSLEENLTIVKTAFSNTFNHDIPSILRYLRKRLDLIGNDYYLAHIYRTIHWWTAPTHVTVLGDLLGSQWISDEEFEERSGRFWNRIFRGAHKVEDAIMRKSSIEPLKENSTWTRRIINIAGNHDIGYAGDINQARVDRFEQAFGKVNWDIRFQLPASAPNKPPNPFVLGGPPELRIVVLNTMNMDGPALDHKLQVETYDFLNDHIVSSQKPVGDERSATILLTHIPLYKEAGVCVDWPYFDYTSTGIKEQNHLSPEASTAILEGIFGKSLDENAPAQGRGRQGLIMTGHDHEGCDLFHHAFRDPQGNGSQWKATRREYAYNIVNSPIPSLREITVRSMMGSFGGTAGLLSGWYDYDKSEWRFEYATCPLGTQHIWWAVHVLQLIALSLLFISGLAYMREPRKERPKNTSSQKALPPSSPRDPPQSAKASLKVPVTKS